MTELFSPFHGTRDALRVAHDDPLIPVGAGLANQERDETAAVKASDFGYRHVAEIEHRGHKIDIAGERVAVPATTDTAVWVAYQERHAVASLVGKALLPTHARIETAPAFERKTVFVEIDSGSGSVVGHEDEDSVVSDPNFLEPGHKDSEILVDIFDHSVEPGAVFMRRDCAVGFDVLVLDVKGSMGGVRCDVTEERLLGVLLDKFHPLAKKDVGAVPFELFGLAVDIKGVVEVIVAPRVTGGADSPPIRAEFSYLGSYFRLYDAGP